MTVFLLIMNLSVQYSHGTSGLFSLKRRKYINFGIMSELTFIMMNVKLPNMSIGKAYLF